MRWRLRRFVAVGTAVTAADVGILLGLTAGLGLAPVPADAAALAVAVGLSWALHRWITFAGSPYARWVRRPGLVALTAAVGAAVDLTVFTGVLVAAGGPPAMPVVLTAKAIALAVASTVRLVAYRAVLLAEVRRSQGSPVARPPAGGDLRLTVVLPAYCEEARIAATVRNVRAALAPVAEAGGVEVLVVDDGSPDATAAEAARAGATVLRLPVNSGKGAAVRAGALVARGATVAFTDADLAYDPRLLLELLAEVETGWDVAVGSRYHPLARGGAVAGGRPRAGPGAVVRRVSGRLFNLLTGAVLLGQYRDTQCGLKAFRGDVARLLFSRTRLDGFAFDVEVFHLIERYRLTLREIPASAHPAGGASTVRLGIEAARMVRDLLRLRRWAWRGVYDPAPGDVARPEGTAPRPAH